MIPVQGCDRKFVFRSSSLRIFFERVSAYNWCLHVAIAKKLRLWKIFARVCRRPVFIWKLVPLTTEVELRFSGTWYIANFSWGFIPVRKFILFILRKKNFQKYNIIFSRLFVCYTDHEKNSWAKIKINHQLATVFFFFLDIFGSKLCSLIFYWLIKCQNSSIPPGYTKRSLGPGW